MGRSSIVGVKGGTLVPNELSGTDPVVMRKRRKKVAGAVAGQRERGGPAEGNSSHPQLGGPTEWARKSSLFAEKCTFPPKSEKIALFRPFR